MFEKDEHGKPQRKLYVKIYSRAAAGQKLGAEDLRPPWVLARVMRHVMEKALSARALASQSFVSVPTCRRDL